MTNPTKGVLISDQILICGQIEFNWLIFWIRDVGLRACKPHPEYKPITFWACNPHLKTQYVNKYVTIVGSHVGKKGHGATHLFKYLLNY